jgi:hypothetical protein
MMIDEQTLTEALHNLDVVIAPDLSARVRRDGQRRLLRRRSLAAAGAVAVGSAAVPATIALRAAVGSGALGAASGPGSDATLSELYAPPPPPGSRCTEGTSRSAAPAAYPQLLLLPLGQDLTSAVVRAGISQCRTPHIALTLVHTAADTVTEGVVVDGPNAPTAVEDGFGPGSNPIGDTGSLPILGVAGIEFTADGHTDAYWTEPDGGQWHAQARGMSQQAAVALFDQLALDSHAGTATIAPGAAPGWTVAPAALDAHAGAQGTVMSEWVDSSGHTVDMNVTAEPNRIDQEAASAALDATLVTVNGQPGVLVADARTATLIWAPADNVEADITVNDGTSAEVEQIAASLSLAAPNDPRFAQS